ncbi:DUF948 domain-containing protein [Candidatus Oleimmundimicrobium sp.]|uniref:DUF948 domain-containing protein n=1 Tax=Candidatus Oleimmundimicrobium sp. TaxID=3060597 RepID=UPI002726FA38|nr:DUF948 domain-containing protein [Candidatus Oleimmundimicrobium sp.]MDO8886738.1 DUF948 domain-containing protein [Candidatus Oleimmundimicrobium sp.]
MNWLNFLYLVLSIAIIGISIGLVILLARFSKTLNNINKLVEDVQREVMPIVSDLQVTVNKVNDGLSRIDEITGSVKDISGRFNLVVKILQEAVSSPLIKLAGVSAGAKKVINTLIKREDV